MSRSAWIGSSELEFCTWRPGLTLHHAPIRHLPHDYPTIIGFRVYTKLLAGKVAVGQLEGRATALGLDEEESAELARQEYFYSQEQVDDEVSNLIFAAASSGDVHVIIPVQDIGKFIIEHKDCIFTCLNAAVDYILLKHYLETADSMALEIWNTIADECRLRDVYILDGLVRLGLEDGRTLCRPFEEIAKEFSGFAQIPPDAPRRLAPSVSTIYSVEPIAPHDDTIACNAVVDAILIQASYREMVKIAFSISFSQQSEMFSVAPFQYGPLSEGIQVKGSIVLYDITKNGIAIDCELAKKVHAKLEERLSSAVDALMKNERTRSIFHISVSGDGTLCAAREGAKPKIDAARLEELLTEEAAEISSTYQMDMSIPRIAGGGLSRAPRTWSEYSHLSTFLKTWIDMEQAAHFNTFLSHLNGSDRAHPQYTIMVRNGRTSAQNPPIQQTPRKGGFREMFRAKPGHVLVAIDYEFIELCTLAAVCLARYGNSVLAQVICQGVDPHAFTASMIEGVSLHTFMAWKTSSDAEVRKRFTILRQRAKAINFGIPSGLTAAGLSLYAKGAYGVELTQEEAERFRTTLIKDIYPELSRYLEEGDMQRLAANLGVPLSVCWRTFSFAKSGRHEQGAVEKSREAVEGGMRNIVRGAKFRKRDGKEYNAFFVKKIWSGLKKLAKNPEHFRMISEAETKNQGSEELYKSLFGRPVTTLTGRVRGKVGFTQACNTPFSGLAADGAKLAMWNLYQLGYTLVGFIHDEVLLEIPESPDGTYDTQAEEIKNVMVLSMRELTGPIPVGVQLSVSYVWSKEAHAVYNDKGQLIPWVSDVDPTQVA